MALGWRSVVEERVDVSGPVHTLVLNALDHELTPIAAGVGALIAVTLHALREASSTDGLQTVAEVLHAHGKRHHPPLLVVVGLVVSGVGAATAVSGALS